jgi:hypothetical protein
MTELIAKVSTLISREAGVECPVSPDDAVCSSVCLRQLLRRFLRSGSTSKAWCALFLDAGCSSLQTQTLHKLHSDCNSMRCADHSLAVADVLAAPLKRYAAHQLPGPAAYSKRGGWLRPHSRRVGQGAVEHCRRLDLACTKCDQASGTLQSSTGH